MRIGEGKIMIDMAPFNKSTMHPLSKDERDAFFERFDLTGRNFTFGSDRRKIRAALNRALETPTGREQARQIINYEPKDFKFEIECSSFGDKLLEIRGSRGANVSQRTTYIHSETLNSVDESAEILMHELKHARQHKGSYSNVQADSETQALTVQMGLELGHGSINSTDPSYNKSFYINYKKWLDIAKNPRKTPEGALKFQPSKELSSQELRTAQKLYATQMASVETRSQYIKDFLKGSSKIQKGTDNLHVASYHNRYLRALYEHQDDDAYLKGLQLKVSEGSVNDFKKEYMGISDSDFDTLRMQLNQDKERVSDFEPKEEVDAIKKEGLIPVAESAEFRLKSEDDEDSLIRTLSGVKDNNIKTTLNKFKNGQKLTLSEGQDLLFEYAKRNDSLDKNIRINTMIRAILIDQQINPKPNKKRTKMIHDLEKVSGKKMPIVQNESSTDPNLTKKLRECGNPVSDDMVQQDTTNAYLSAPEYAYA